MVVLWLALTLQARATVFTTVADGAWNDTTVWSGTGGPGYSFGDTVEIRHCVLYDEPLHMLAGSRVVLADSGKLCGHRNIHVTDGAWFYVYGRLYFDTLFVTYGHLLVRNNFQAFIGHLIHISGIGATGQFFGPWSFQYNPYICSCSFDSFLEYPPDTAMAEPEAQPFNIAAYPNPFTGVVYFTTHRDIVGIVLADTRGRLVWRSESDTDHADFSDLSPGTYFLTFFLASGETEARRLVKMQ
jgi:hypothetical protein